MSTKATVIHDSFKEFECGNYSQYLKTLEDIQFPTFDILEWVRDNNATICSLVSKQFTQTTSQIIAKVDDDDNARVKLGNLLTKIRTFNSTENNLGLVTECAVLYNLILLHSKNQPEQNSTQKFFGENLNSHLEITVKRILATTNSYPSNCFFDNDEPNPTLSNAVDNESLLCCLKPLLHLWSCVVSTSEKQQLEPLVTKLLVKNSKEMVKWDLRFALPPAAGLANKNPPSGTIGNNMTAMFQILDLALRTDTFHSEIAERIKHVGWIPYVHYVQAFCLYRKCEYQKALDLLNNPEQNFTGDTLESFVSNLKGCCLFKLGHGWSGIQKLQSALKKNFSFLLPLYNVAVIHKHEQKQDAELDSLRRLVKALESKGDESKECVEFRLNRFEISKSSSYSLLTLPYALYLQSHRSLQLGHFTESSEHFLNLLTVLMETPIFQPSDSFTNTSPIPGVAEIHLEAAFCMLSAERYMECVAICDWLLSRISDSSPVPFHESFEESSIFDKNDHSDQEDEDFLFGDSETSKKRPHSKISSTNYAKHCITDSEPSSVNDVLVSALLYKADAYFHLQEIENVFSCLQRATKIIKSEDANLIPASPERQPLSKRQKVISGSQTTSDPHLMEQKTKRDHRTTLISSTYNNTGVLLQCKGQFQEALHCFRLGLQINSCDPSLNFNCALTLIQLGDVEKAAFFWAKHRGFDLSMNRVQLQNKKSEKQKELESLQNTNCENPVDAIKITDTPTTCTLLRFDICILHRLLHSK